ncbi:MAG: hypothetical protein M0033_07905 [Nitrospiraceae bacterium]|nr:hypothetical protein [Nitrospiraceae bacterium]MDA8326128.1 hypothetical protein [Nitrospiraceae bacterium]
MTIELFLVILESVLLAFTVLLLLDSIREGRARSRLLLEVDRATKTFTRLEYFLSVVDSMADARHEVMGLITGRYPGGDDRKRTKDIVNAIEKAGKAGVQVKYLLPRFHDRLYVGCLYSSAGAQVRYSSCPILHDLRYMTIDDRVTVIGIPEGAGEKEATKKGYKIISEGLNSVLREHFNNCWGAATPYGEYLKEVIRETKASPRQLAIELKIDEKDLEKFYRDA